MLYLWSEEQSVHARSSSYYDTLSVRVELNALVWLMTYACARNNRPRPVTDCDIQVMLSNLGV